MSGLNALFQRDAPPLQRWTAPVPDYEGLLSKAAALPDTRLLALDGALLPDAPALFRVLASGLRFPAYFGGNWDALDECLHDLEWLTDGAILLAVRNAQRLLEAEPQGLESFLSILVSATKELEEPQMGEVCLRRIPIQLRLLLHTNGDVTKAKLSQRLEQAGLALAEFRG
jgi:hypothetical protein